MANYPPAAPFFGMPYAPTFPPANAPPAPSPVASFQNQTQLPQQGQQPQMQQAQTAAGFQQNASLPPMDINAFNAIWSQVQSGAIPPFPPPFAAQPGFPPPPPPIPFPGFQPPPTPGFPVPPPTLPANPAYPIPQASATTAPDNRITEMMSADKEEGELSDDVGSKEATSVAAVDPMRSQPGQRVYAKDRRPSGGDRYRPGADTRSPRGYGSRTNSDPYRHESYRDRNEHKPEAPAQWGELSDRRSPTISSRDLPHRGNRVYDAYRPGNDRAHQSQESTYSANPGLHSRTSSSLDLQPSSSKPNNEEDTRTVPNGKAFYSLAKEREEAETFIKLLDKLGYGFADLLKEKLDPKLLRELYSDLSLPLVHRPAPSDTTVANSAPAQGAAEASPQARQATTAHPSTSIKPVQAAAPAAQPSPVASLATTKSVQAQPLQKPTEKPAVTIPTIKPTASQVTSPSVDRAEYIKRLMAAKNSKANSATKTAAQPAASSPPASEKAPATTAASQTSKTVVNTEQPKPIQEAPRVTDPDALAAQKKAAQNELLRKKIEALKLQRPATEGQNGAGNTSSGNRTPIAPSISSNVQPSYPNAGTSESQVAAPPAPALQAPSPRGIPGLFMTSVEPRQQASPKPLQAPLPAVTANQGRKRPVAADFEDMQRAPPSAFKRPFGQNRYENDHEDLIIEVSDDESDGSDMDIDDDIDEPQPAPVAPKPSGQSLSVASRNLPPLTDFPPRPSFSRQSSVQAATPGAQTPGTAADLKRKEEEIAALKKQLAERELQRKAKLQLSRAQTPVTPKQAPQISTARDIASPSPILSQPNAVLTPSCLQSTSAAATTATSTPKERSFSIAAEQSSAPQSPAENSEWKKRRRAELQSSISASDAGLYSNLSRLELLKREMEQIEAENRRRQLEKEQLIRELEDIGVDTEGMPHEELQAKKNEIMQQQELEAAKSEGDRKISWPEAEVSVQPEESSSSGAATPEEAPLSANTTPANAQQSPVKQFDADQSDNDMSEGEIDESDTTDAEMEMSDSEVEEDESSAPEPAIATPALTSPPVGNIPQLDKVHDAQTKPMYPAEASELEDTEDFYSPEPPPAADQRFQEPDSARVSTTDSPYNFEDSLEPGEAAEENINDYEVVPTLPPADAADSRSDVAMDEEEDDYEPSDAVPEPTQAISSAFTSELPTPQTASTPNLTGLELPHSAENTQVALTSEAAFDVSEAESSSQLPQNPVIADDLAPELQPSSSQQVEVLQTSVPSREPTWKHFLPYESPLKQFKAYRYHPEYSGSIPGGFRSLTYSHDIDPMKPLCPYELAGGVCNDNECDGQHFRAMGISEDKVLVQLGLVNPGRTEEEQQEWRTGLRSLLKSLREQNVRNAEAVASAITEYRRKFLKDPSRVLNL